MNITGRGIPFPTDLFLDSLTAENTLTSILFKSIQLEPEERHHQKYSLDILIYFVALGIMTCSSNTYIHDSCVWDDKNWESLCHYVASNTFLKDLTIFETPRTDITGQRAACTSIFLDAMERNTSLVEFILLARQDQRLWSPRVRILLERNQIRAIATVPESIRRQLIGRCFNQNLCIGIRASFHYLALRSSELDDNFMARLQALTVMSVKRARII
jgi:hypothetical protein